MYVLSKCHTSEIPPQLSEAIRATPSRDGDSLTGDHLILARRIVQLYRPKSDVCVRIADVTEP